MPMPNMSQNRTALAKLILIGAGIAMVFASLGFWSLALSGRGEVASALLAATRVQPVQFTTEDALKARERLDKLAQPAGAAVAPSGGPRQAGAGMAPGQPMPPAPTPTPAPGFNRGPLSETFAALLEQRPLFGAPPKPGPPSANVQGILGDQALINGQWVKVGSDMGGIKLLATLTDKVVVEIAGRQQEVSVWQPLPNNPMPPSPPQMTGQGGGSPGNSAASARERAMMQQQQQQQRRAGATGAAAARDALGQRARLNSSAASRERERLLERGTGAAMQPTVEIIPSGSGGGATYDGQASGGTRTPPRTTRRQQNPAGGGAAVNSGNSSAVPARTPKAARTPRPATATPAVKKAVRKSRGGVSASGGAQPYPGGGNYAPPPDPGFAGPPAGAGDPYRAGTRN